MLKLDRLLCCWSIYSLIIGNIAMDVVVPMMNV